MSRFEQGQLAIHHNGRRTLEIRHRLNGNTRGGAYRLVVRSGNVVLSDTPFMTENRARAAFERRMEAWAETA